MTTGTVDDHDFPGQGWRGQESFPFLFAQDVGHAHVNPGLDGMALPLDRPGRCTRARVLGPGPTNVSGLYLEVQVSGCVLYRNAIDGHFGSHYFSSLNGQKGPDGLGPFY